MPETKPAKRQLSNAVSDTAYDKTSWDGVTDVAPSKNAVRDKVEAMPTTGEVFAMSQGIYLM